MALTRTLLAAQGTTIHSTDSARTREPDAIKLEAAHGKRPPSKGHGGGDVRQQPLRQREGLQGQSQRDGGGLDRRVGAASLAAALACGLQRLEQGQAGGRLDLEALAGGQQERVSFARGIAGGGGRWGEAGMKGVGWTRSGFEMRKDREEQD